MSIVSNIVTDVMGNVSRNVMFSAAAQAVATDPNDVSQPITALFAFERLVPEYAGDCFQVRDSTNTLRTIGFDVDGTLDTTGMSGFGDGVTFTLATWYDQSGNSNDATSSFRPSLVFPNAPTDYLNPYIDDTYGARNITTTATFDFAGTANVAAFVAYSKLGYGAAAGPFPRPGVPSTSVALSSVLGYGTLSSGILIANTPNLGNAQESDVSFSRTRDSLGRSSCVYNLGEELMLDETDPSASNDFITAWFNQTGANVSGGGDQRLHWSDRPHGISGVNGRLTIGTAGNLGLGHNGGIKEVILFQNASPLTDIEAQGVGMWQDDRLGGQNTVVDPRYFTVFTGQSNSNAHLNNNVSGDNTAGTESANRRFSPKFAQALGITEDRLIYGLANRTAVGGSPMMKRKAPADPDNTVYWWDEDTNSPGNLMTALQGSEGDMLAYFDALPYLKYKRVLILHAQGEEDSTGALTDDRIDEWAEQTYTFLDYVRNYSAISQPNAPIVLQPLARYAGVAAAQLHRVTTMRRVQTSYLSVQSNVFLAADTGHNARGTGANYEAHFGTMDAAANGGFDSTTGTLEDGYQRVAWQDALAAGQAIADVYSEALAVDHGWRGPVITDISQTSSNLAVATISYPDGCLGTDIQTESGTFGGFRAWDGGGDLTILSTVRLSATQVRVQFAATIPAGTSIAYEPIYASGVAEGANVRNQMVDNNPNIKMPVESSQVYLIS